MARDKRSASVVLLAAVALVVLGSWLLLFEDEASQTPIAGLETAEQAADGGTPRLLGVEGPRGADPPHPAPKATSPEATSPEESPAADVAGKRVRPDALEGLRVLDATGRPIQGAQITLIWRAKGGDRPVSVQTGRDGTAFLILVGDGPILRLTVKWSDKTLFSTEDEDGVDLDRIGDIRADELYLLHVRTVDSAGKPRALQRVLYRPREEAKDPTGWWGNTSDEQGRCRLGPWKLGTRIELLAGPRGLGPEAIAESSAWQEVRVDGTDVEVDIGEAPRLRLAFPGSPRGAALQITVLDMDSGRRVFPSAQHVPKNGIWTAEALTENARLEVVVLDARRGFFARLLDVVPAGYAIDVALERGVRISGRVFADDVRGIEEGAVTATGRGFQASIHVDARGRFTFVGLPDEPFTLDARIRAGASDLEQHLGRVERTNERDLRIRVGRLVRITGRLVATDAVALGRWVSSFTVTATSPDWPGTRTLTVVGGGHFRLELPEGRWRVTARGPATEQGTLQGATELGYVAEDRKDVVIELRVEDR